MMNDLPLEGMVDVDVPRQGASGGRALFRPDYQDAKSDILPSFPDIRNKTLRTLYSSDGQDKSSKGSVDAHIRDLLDLINQHPSYATLSSCSGRVSLFGHGEAERKPALDHVPITSASTDEFEDDPERASSKLSSGKGFGGWMLVSHDEIDPSSLLTTLQINQNELGSGENGGKLSFRFEPMILHVAASTLERGKQLLQIVLQLGFRESGLVATSSRVTVAIRGYGLAFTVPLARSGLLAPPPSFIEGLVHEANSRLRQNLERIEGLRRQIELELFRPLHISSFRRITVDSLPDLQLWGHAAVALESKSDGRCIVVFGGYGRGPQLESNGLDHEASQGAKRSDKVYALHQRNGLWQRHWTLVDVISTQRDSLQSSYSSYQIECRPTRLIAFEGAAATLLAIQGEPYMIALFGGREGPAKPLSDLLLFEYRSGGPSQFLKPMNIRGKPPSPRWGHTLTSLMTDGTAPLAILIGGRNAFESVSDPVHLLSLLRSPGLPSHFLWEEVYFPVPSCRRFHHCTVEHSGNVFIFGGISKPQSILEAFSDIDHRDNIVYFDAKADAKNLLQALTQSTCSPRFGHKATVVGSSNKSTFSVLVTGGVSASNCVESVGYFEWIELSLDQVRCKVQLKSFDVDFAGQDKNLGALVHHASICEKATESIEGILCVFLVGGGVPGFSFSPCYAKSSCLTVNNCETEIPSSSAVTKLPETRKDSPARKADIVSEPTEVDVIYVSSVNAKSLKTQLEAAQILDKTRRMGKATSFHDDAEGNSFIAVPILPHGLSILQRARGLDDMQYSWISLVEGTGKQALPFSTSVFARQKRFESGRTDSGS